MKQKKLQINRERRAQRVHYKIQMTAAGKPRVAVFRSLNQIYVQLVDDATGKTIRINQSDLSDNVDEENLPFSV